MKNSHPTGTHYVMSLWGCESAQINSVPFWKKLLKESAQKSKLEILKTDFHKFKPWGVTGFLLLSTSHISVHTWPEYNYVACDIFSCGKAEDTKKAADYIVKHLKHSKIKIDRIDRGYTIDEKFQTKKKKN